MCGVCVRVTRLQAARLSWNETSWEGDLPPTLHLTGPTQCNYVEWNGSVASLLCFLSNCCCSNNRMSSHEGRIKECVFPERLGSDVFLICVTGSAKTPKHAGTFCFLLEFFEWTRWQADYKQCSSSWRVLWGCDSCVSSAQLPYLLLNTTGPDPKTRMHPVFFGESIEVNPKPEQEIK